VTERNVSLLFSGELLIDYYDGLQPAEENERLDNFWEVCLYGKLFLKYFL
jgi:hypothetical protein